MYRSNVPGQFNGNRLPSNKDLNAVYGISAQGQSQLRNPAMQSHNVQQFQNPVYGSAAPQLQYQTSQGTVYSNNPYAYNQGKPSEMQHSMTSMNSFMSSGNMYPGIQSQPSAGASGDFSIAQENSLSTQQYQQQGKPMSTGWNTSGTDSNAMRFGPNPNALYNGSQQYRTNIQSIQSGARPSESAVRRHSLQTSTYLEGNVQHSGNLQSYQQQLSTPHSHFQQGQVPGASSQSSMYMQQQYINQPQSSSFVGRQSQMSSGLQQGTKVRTPFDDGSLMMQQQNALQQQQNSLQQQQQVAMKQAQSYHLKSSSGNSASNINQTPQQQVMGVGGNPLQQAMSPHHTSPLSPPVRGVIVSRSNVVPPVSPQLQTSRSAQPSQQVSPLIHPPGSMSPSTRMPSYSPKQQITSNLLPGYKGSGLSRPPTPRNDANRGFVSPPQMMSPPPPVMQPSSVSQSQSNRLPMSYNGEVPTQHFYNQPGRFPHWQTMRQQTVATSNPNILDSGPVNVQVSNQTPRPTHLGMSQHIPQSPSRFGQTSLQLSNQPGFQPSQNVRSSINKNQQINNLLSNAPSGSNTMSQSSDFDTDFNLDSLLGDPVEGAGSFMQQLQDVAPSSTKLPSLGTNILEPQTLPSIPDALPVVAQATTDSLVFSLSSNLTQGLETTNSTVTSSISLTNAPQVVKNMVSSHLTDTLMSNSSINVNEDDRLDSGEITLESTEQDLMKAASSLPISFAEANLPSSVSLPVLEEQQNSYTISQTATVNTTAPLSVLSVTPSTSLSTVQTLEDMPIISSAQNVLNSNVVSSKTIESSLLTLPQQTITAVSVVTTSTPLTAFDTISSVTEVVQSIPSAVTTSVVSSNPISQPGIVSPPTQQSSSASAIFPRTAGHSIHPSQEDRIRPSVLGDSVYQIRPIAVGGPPRPPPVVQSGVSSGVPRLPHQDPGLIRSQGKPPYSSMPPRFQQPRPYGPSHYGPHLQTPSGPYPSSSAHPGRLPYNQTGPPMPRGPRLDYMGHPRPYPMHSQQHQHLQQQLQNLNIEAQKLQHQFPLVQQEEAEASKEGTLPTDQPRRSDQIRRRIMEINHNINQIRMQLAAPHHSSTLPQTMQDSGQTMPLRYPGSGFNESESTNILNDDVNKKKRARKQKPLPKTPKGEGDDMSKPPKKKKKKDMDDDISVNEKRKKKKVKKAEISGTSSLPASSEALLDEANIDSSQDGTQTTATTDIDTIEDGSLSFSELSEPPPKLEKPKSKKKKPVATVVKPKKKRKRAGYDSSDDTNAFDVLQKTPPPSPEDSLIEKRRSGRNVKRKRYVESVDLSFSGDDDDDEGDFHIRPSKKTERLVELNEMTEADDVMIVEKILSHRKRTTRIRKKSSADEETEETGQDNKDKKHSVSEDLKSETDVDPSEGSLEQTEVPTSQSGPMLSPSSSKNPRIRKFSLAASETEEITEENAEDEYFVKYKNYSYLHCDWKTKVEIEDKRFDQKLKRYLAKNTTKDGQLIYPEHEVDELFNPDFVEVDRVLDVTHNDSDDGQTARLFLVKWCSLPYEDSTWEQEEDIEKLKIQEFEARCRYRPPRKLNRPQKESWKRLTPDNTRFCNGNVLRDYQFEGLNWLLFNWYNKRNCILADEMGLGKTIQSITFLQKIFDHGIPGPFLVVAPLSTIANWQREFASWTTINAIVYHGSQTSRDMIHTYEWFCRDENLDEIEGSYKIHAVITTYEMVVLDSPHLREVDWRCLILDEAHRLKNLSCKLVESLRAMQLEHKVLLTGTPLQNNVEELFALLTFLQPDTFNCQQTFSLEFGNLKENSQVEKLQELLKPMMLRRLKEDVEKSLAPKQETIIEVELTNIQKKYYRAILERNFTFLSKGTSGGNVPNLMNTMMELRKCCNHPYLIKGAEDKIMQEQKAIFEEFNSLQAMIQSSGKLVLIDKLLPRLKEGGHKVLIFSQMVRVLDILEDYLVQRNYLYERIDGCIRGNERQMAIDRFSRKGSDRFVFLLCTRAGGLGINLTAADTVIIFDSDWNPQNDLQAQARCHRIGQQKPVKVYRLITRNSYEREMFDKASLKLGLDKAVLQSISGRQDQPSNQAPQLSKHEVEDLLKRGAYGAIMDDDDAASKFCEEDIDQILDRRARTVTLESGEKGSTFSKASFVSAEDRADIALDDPNFWEKWAKKADLDVNRLKDNKLILASTRNRKQTRRFGGNSDDQEIFAEIGSDSDDSAEYDSDGNENGGRKGKFRSRAGGAGGGQRRGWGRRDCFRIEKCLLTFGWGRWTAFQQRGRFGGLISPEELEEMSRTVLIYCLKYYNGDDKIKFFIWDLITPVEHAEKAGIDLKNHEGLTAPVPRGRKGRRNKDDPEKVQDEQAKREWARDINLEVQLPDEGFKKHIQHQCNKIILRVRMLYYLRTEILSGILPAIDEGTKYSEIEFEMVEKLNDPPADWWDATCDKCLLIGIYKHGYEKYNVIRADNMLCFLERVGPPDDRALAAEMDVEPDDTDGDPEYKPARITFDIEIGESPTPDTPNTEPPSSPASVDAKKKEEEIKDSKEETSSAPAKKDEAVMKEWPSMSELNTRLRRIVTVYQKHYKQMQQRLLNMHRRSGRGSKFSDNSAGVDARRIIPQARWTRREESDFYRTVSTFGIERDSKTREITWRKFRNVARLDKKTDDDLRAYYLAFRRMCEQICQWKGEPGTSDGTGVGCNEEVPNIPVEPITEERASRTLYRIRLLDKVRCDVLPHPKLKERINLCQRGPELPIWWHVGVHDYELLLGIDRHGLTRTELYLLTDKDFTFVDAMKEFDADPVAFRKKLLEQEKYNYETYMKTRDGDKEAAKDLSIKLKSTESPLSLKKETKVETDAETEKKDVISTKDEDSETPKENTSPETVEEQPERVEEDKKEEKNEEVDEPKKADVGEEKQAKEDVAKEEKEPKEPDVKEEMEVKEEDIKEEKETIQEDVKAESSGEAQPMEVCHDAKNEKSDNELALDEKKESPAVSDVKTENLELEKDAKPLKDKKDEVSKSESEEIDEKPAIDLSTKSDTSKQDQEKVKPEKIDNEAPNLDSGEDLKKTPTVMALRSKTNPLLQDFSNFAQMPAPYFMNSMNSRWPKDRVLMLRVEQVCYCVINGEWPKSCQSLLPSMSNANDAGGGNYSSGRSQSSTPLSEDRSTPVPTPFSAIHPNPADINRLAANDKQLQAAMAQLLASSESATRTSISSRRGRRKRRTDQHMSVSGGNPMQFSNQAVTPLDKELQRKIEQLMAGNVTSPQSTTTGTLFTPLSSRSDTAPSKPSTKSTSGSGKIDDVTGNSSASLLANLRELASAEIKGDHASSSRSRSRAGSSRRHSPSPSQSRAKETNKINNDLMKSQQQFIPTPEQLLAMNVPLQQLMQDALKAGIDPMTAMATFLPLFPWIDPFQAMNPPKSESLPQMSSQSPLPSPAEMEKLLKNMGLPPEIAMLSGILPGPSLTSSSKFKETSKETKTRESRSETVRSSEPFTPVTSAIEKPISSVASDRSNLTPAKKKGISKLDSMFGMGKSEDESPSRSSGSSAKKSRKSKFVSPAMLPAETRIPVHNNAEGIRLSGNDAPLNKDLADWLKDNSGFVVDYQALRQQHDEPPVKKLEPSSEAGDPSVNLNATAKSSDLSAGDLKQKIILDKAEALIRNAEKLVEQNKPEISKSEHFPTDEKLSKRDFSLPKSAPSSSPASTRASGSASLSSSNLKQQQQLSELALLQQLNAFADPTTAAALFGMPPELLTPDVLSLLASGLLQTPGGIPPDFLAPGFKPPNKGFDDKNFAEPSRSPSRSSTPSRASPLRHKNPPSESGQLTGDERIPVVNITTGKKLTGKQAPELRTLADYLRTSPDYFVTADWSNVIMKSKFLPKDLHSRLLPARSSTPSKSSQSLTSASNNAAMAAAAFAGLPPGAMFPGLMQGQGMMDPVHLMAALQQMPGQGQLDMKALASSGFPMLPFLGGMPNPLLGGAAFPGQDSAVAAMAALSQGFSPNKERSSSQHDSSLSSDISKSRKSKKHNDKSSERNGSRSSSSSFKPSNQQQLPFSGDPMAEALAALQRSGGLPGMPNPFLAGAANNPLLFPSMMMGGQNSMMPVEMLNPELLAAQMAAFGGIPTIDPPKPSSTPSSSQKRDKRRGSSSSSTSQKQSMSVARSQSRSGADELPMDLTQFAASSSSSGDRKSPDKHKQ